MKKVRTPLNNITGALLVRLFCVPGLGPIPWVIIAEIYPRDFSSVPPHSTFINCMLNVVVSFPWPTMLESMHAQGASSSLPCPHCHPRYLCFFLYPRQRDSKWKLFRVYLRNLYKNLQRRISDIRKRR
eukprot:jgi/Galph1/3979/GphlegSOOS_G2610.1